MKIMGLGMAGADCHGMKLARLSGTRIQKG